MYVQNKNILKTLNLWLDQRPLIINIGEKLINKKEIDFQFFFFPFKLNYLRGWKLKRLWNSTKLYTLECNRFIE